jgi:uncharacterized phage protein (TIGR02218 family)
MTYNAFETSREGGRPIEVYRFIQGGTSFEYTSAEDELVVNTLTYSPEAISRGKIGQSPSDRKTVLEITVPASNTFALRFKVSTPAARARSTVQRLHRSDFPTPEVVTIFDGYVSSVAFEEDGKVAKIACTPVTAAQSRPVPRFSYQGMCNHVLFDDGCKVDDTDANWRLTATATAVTGSVVTVSGAGAFGADWWVGGFMEVNGGDDSRLILSQSGDDLQLLLPFPGSIVGGNVTILAGCDHLIDTCDTKFNTTEDTLSNVINYGGFAFVPTKNPFETGL